MEALITSALTKWAQESNPIKFGESLLLIYVAYLFIKPHINKSMKSIQDHLTKVEGKLDGMIQAVGEVKNALITLERDHDKELEKLDERVRVLESKK